MPQETVNFVTLTYDLCTLLLIAKTYLVINLLSLRIKNGMHLANSISHYSFQVVYRSLLTASIAVYTRAPTALLVLPRFDSGRTRSFDTLRPRELPTLHKDRQRGSESRQISSEVLL